MTNMKKILLVLGIVSLTGCATTQRMDIQDICTMHADCSNAEAQIKFLESQMSTQTDRMVSRMSIGSIGGAIMGKLDGTYEQHRALGNREYDACAKQIIWELRTYCPQNTPRIPR